VGVVFIVVIKKCEGDDGLTKKERHKAALVARESYRVLPGFWQRVPQTVKTAILTT